MPDKRVISGGSFMPFLRIKKDIKIEGIKQRAEIKDSSNVRLNLRT